MRNFYYKSKMNWNGAKNQNVSELRWIESNQNQYDERIYEGWLLAKPELKL